MKSRARPYRTFGNLQVHVMAPEDIFLFKGITEREADLDDMRILAEIGLDWKAIEAECLSQKRSGRWAYLRGQSSWSCAGSLTSRRRSSGPLWTMRTWISWRMRSGRLLGTKIPFKQIARAINEKYGYKDSWTRKQLVLLEARGLARKRRRGREDFYSMTTIGLSRLAHVASRSD